VVSLAIWDMLEKGLSLAGGSPSPLELGRRRQAAVSWQEQSSAWGTGPHRLCSGAGSHVVACKHGHPGLSARDWGRKPQAERVGISSGLEEAGLCHLEN